jgi:hypothetical protein
MRATRYFGVVLLALGWSAVCLGAASDRGYCVVVSKATSELPDWRLVVASLLDKHDDEVLECQVSMREVLPALRQRFPLYVCFVATPAEATREFVAEVHRVTRRLDSDPYVDAVWGILTGYDAACGLRCYPAGSRRTPGTAQNSPNAGSCTRSPHAADASAAASGAARPSTP